MNDLDEMHEDVLCAVRESFYELEVPMCPSPEGIIAAAHSRRRRRRVTVGAAGLATAALVAVVVPSLAPAHKAAPSATASSATASTATTAAAPPTRLAAFDAVTHADGTTTYTLSSDLLSEDPAALTATLAQHGIPAIVRQGSFCSSHPAPADIAQIFVAVPVGPHGVTGDRKAVAIDPSAMPAGTALSIGLSSAGGSTAVHLALVNKNDYFCAAVVSPGADSADQPTNKPSTGADSNHTVRRHPAGTTP